MPTLMSCTPVVQMFRLQLDSRAFDLRQATLSPFHQEKMEDTCTTIDVMNLIALYKVQLL